MLLTPSDLGGLGRADLNKLLGGEDPCETATDIYFEQAYNRELSASDCQLEDGSFVDFYVFEGLQGEQATVFMSASFDAYLGLANESGTFILEDDDSGGGPNAMIQTTLPETGLYVILANSYLPNQFGSYYVSLRGGPACTFTFAPAPPQIPHTGGTYTFSVSTQPRCFWVSSSTDSYVATDSRALGSGTVTFTVAANPSGFQRTGSVRVRNGYYSFFQSGIPCNFTINPTSVNIPATQTTGTFSISGPSQCLWSADSLGNGLSAQGSGFGNGTVTFTASHNNGRARTGLIRAGGQMFTVNQAGLNCTYSASPRSLVASASGRPGRIKVDTQPGCTWGVQKHMSWLDVQPGIYSGPGYASYIIQPNTGPTQRSGVIILGAYADPDSVSFNVYVEQSGRYHPIDFDYDADGSADISVMRPSDNLWYLLRQTAGYTALKWGETGDRMVPADYNGDGKTDIAVFRPSTGQWFVVNSSTGAFEVYGWGQNGDIPVPADHDGDGKADLVLFRPSNGTWYLRSTLTGPIGGTQFGQMGDKPQVGDFDGDGRADPAVYRPSNNTWYIRKSSSGYFVQTWGQPDDIPVPADYDGDAAVDLAVFRPSTGQWYRVRSTAGYDLLNWGQNGDIPAPADYDGDGRSDAAVFRPTNNTWYIINTTAGIQVRDFGLAGDVPTASSFIY